MERTPRMPDPAVPNSAHDPRHSPDVGLAGSRIEIDFGPDNLLEEKIYDPWAPGTRGDETGIAAEIIRQEQARS